MAPPKLDCSPNPCLWARTLAQLILKSFKASSMPACVAQCCTLAMRAYWSGKGSKTILYLVSRCSRERKFLVHSCLEIYSFWNTALTLFEWSSVCWPLILGGEEERFVNVPLIRAYNFRVKWCALLKHLRHKMMFPKGFQNWWVFVRWYPICLSMQDRDSKGIT